MAEHSASFTVELRSSHLLLSVGSVVHLLAFVAMLIASVTVWFKVIVGVSLGLSLWRFWGCNGLGQWHDRIVRVAWVDGRWQLITSAGAVFSAELVDGYSHPFLVILSFRLEDKRRRSLTLLSDSTSADSLRRLRVFLRTQRATNSVDGAHR